MTTIYSDLKVFENFFLKYESFQFEFFLFGANRHKLLLPFIVIFLII